MLGIQFHAWVLLKNANYTNSINKKSVISIILHTKVLNHRKTFSDFIVLILVAKPVLRTKKTLPNFCLTVQAEFLYIKKTQGSH